MKHTLIVPPGARRRLLSAPTLGLVVALLVPAAFAQDAGPAGSDFDADDEDGYDQAEVVRIHDPLERVNRGVFAFNDKLYDWVLRPVARSYERVVPAAGRRGVKNFFENLGAPVRIVNSALQGKLDRAGRETGKLAVNTVAGVGGLFKISDRVEALTDVPEEDLGQTLGVWRIGQGPYLVLPVFGPSTLRDTLGDAGDHFLDPLEWGLIEDIDGYDWTWKTALETAEIVQGLPGALAVYDATTEAAIDPYLAVRAAYVQNRDAETRK